MSIERVINECTSEEWLVADGCDSLKRVSGFFGKLWVNREQEVNMVDLSTREKIMLFTLAALVLLALFQSSQDASQWQKPMDEPLLRKTSTI